MTTEPPPPPPPRPELPHQPPPRPPQGKTSGFAIASFVLGLIGGVVLSVIFGVVALRRIRERGLRGRGFAVAGLVLSGVWTLVIAAGVTIALLTDDAERDASGRINESGALSVFDLQTGDCLNDLAETDRTLSVDATPCDRPHEAEVIGTFDLAGDDWPGEETVPAIADERCAEMLGDAGSDGEGEPFYFQPTERSWSEGDREVVCIAMFERPRRGTLEGG